MANIELDDILGIVDSSKGEITRMTFGEWWTKPRSHNYKLNVMHDPTDTVDRVAKAAWQAALEAAEAEVERLKKRNHWLRIGEMVELRSALEKYGRHEKDCPRASAMRLAYTPDIKCTCGFEQALAKGRQE